MLISWTLFRQSQCNESSWGKDDAKSLEIFSLMSNNHHEQLTFQFIDRVRINMKAFPGTVLRLGDNHAS